MQQTATKNTQKDQNQMEYFKSAHKNISSKYEKLKKKLKDVMGKQEDSEKEVAKLVKLNQEADELKRK